MWYTDTKLRHRLTRSNILQKQKPATLIELHISFLDNQLRTCGEKTIQLSNGTQVKYIVEVQVFGNRSLYFREPCGVKHVDLKPELYSQAKGDMGPKKIDQTKLPTDHTDSIRIQLI